MEITEEMKDAVLPPIRVEKEFRDDLRAGAEKCGESLSEFVRRAATLRLRRLTRKYPELREQLKTV